MAQAGLDQPESLARYLARELGPDTALDQPSTGLVERTPFTYATQFR